MSEEDLYIPIQQYINEILSKNFELEINTFVTNRSIPKKILEVRNSVQEVEHQYNYRPDLMFYIEEQNLIGIIEVKDDPLQLKDVYQAKRYSEIIDADVSFLISNQNFQPDDEQLIRSNEMSHIFNYYIKNSESLVVKQINVGIIESSNENRINEIRFINDIVLL